MTRGKNAPPSQRQLRVGEMVRHALAEILERGDLHDPTLTRVPVTVTEALWVPRSRTGSSLTGSTRMVTSWVTDSGGGPTSPPPVSVTVTLNFGGLAATGSCPEEQK